MDDFLAALGLLFALEGLMLAAFPETTRRALEEMGRATPGFLRRAGVISAVVGVVIVYVARQIIS